MITQASMPPADHEIEVSVFGRGMGEAIVAHLGGGRWLTVDSCLDEDDVPVALRYLRRMGVEPETALQLVAVSHWDSDHVGGLATLFATARSARFACSTTLQDPDLVSELVRATDRSMPERRKRSIDQFAGVFAELWQRREQPVWGIRGTVLWEEADLRVWSLSPSSRTQTESLRNLIANTQRSTAPSRERRNYLTMVMWVEVNAHRILLGGDLMRAPAGAWATVIGSPGRRGDRGQVFKVPHHGARSGHDKRVWDELLAPEVPAAVTAFTRSRLPTASDRERLRASTPNAYLAGATAEAPTRTDEDRALIATGTASAGTEPLVGPLGHIRLRAGNDSPRAWTVETFGNAIRI